MTKEESDAIDVLRHIKRAINPTTGLMEDLPIGTLVYIGNGHQDCLHGFVSPLGSEYRDRFDFEFGHGSQGSNFPTIVEVALAIPRLLEWGAFNFNNNQGDDILYAEKKVGGVNHFKPFNEFLP